MGKVIKLEQDYYCMDEKIYTKNEVEIKPGFTVLVGCNGSGKSTLLHQIESQLENEEIKFFSYDNYHEGGSRAKDSANFFGEMDFLAQAIMSSEGEEISLNFGKVASKLGYYIRNKYSDEKEFWILLDAIDSGLSVDNVIEFKDLFNMILKTETDKTVYILVSANEYELARNEQCLDVRNCEYITFNDYEEFREFIIQSRKLKNKRYKKEK